MSYHRAIYEGRVINNKRMEGRYLKQITKDAFEKIGCSENTYFVNGCFFDERTDNLVEKKYELW